MRRERRRFAEPVRRNRPGERSRSGRNLQPGSRGASDKPRDSSAYREDLLALDVLALLDELEIERADYLGYSMGGFIGVSALAQFPDRLDRVVLAGIGINYISSGTVDPSLIANGLLAPSLADVTDPVPRQFRRFADVDGNALGVDSSFTE